MSRVVITVGSIGVSGVDRADTTGLAGRLEGAVARGLADAAPLAADTAPSRVRRTVDVPVVRVRLDKGANVGPDHLGAAVAEAIRSAVQGRGANR